MAQRRKKEKQNFPNDFLARPHAAEDLFVNTDFQNIINEKQNALHTFSK